jgi:arylsulfatase A
MGNDPAPQLYDLSKDIGETENLAEKYPDRVKAMAAQLARIKGE